MLKWRKFSKSRSERGSSSPTAEVIAFPLLLAGLDVQVLQSATCPFTGLPFIPMQDLQLGDEDEDDAWTMG